MFYEDDDIIEAKIFDKMTTKKIKLFAVVKDKNDAFIDLYFQSHGKFYVLSHFNNYPNEPFVEIEEFKDTEEIDFHKGEGCIYYKIDKKDQTLDYLRKDVTGIHSNLFDLTFKQLSIKDITTKKNSNLSIDNKYIINEHDYYDVVKELLPQQNRIKNIER